MGLKSSGREHGAIIKEHRGTSPRRKRDGATRIYDYAAKKAVEEARRKGRLPARPLLASRTP
ncbi:MAG: hypothetical protein MZV70_03475 [Desulfobacterales bacterium]|nr:hypothetical protein [Desulfobacterales bacterium]